MIAGVIISISLGVLLPLFGNPTENPFIFNFIAVSSALFTIAGFWAAFFQLQSVKEVKKRREFEVLEAQSELLKKQLINRISRTYEKLLGMHKLLGDDLHSHFITESEYTIQKLEKIKSDKWLRQSHKNLISEYVNQHRQFEVALKGYIQRNELPDEEIKTNFLYQVSYICSKLSEIQDQLSSELR
ncbi:MAG: hypothetical protein H6581_09215 [Bacteroidia bacterium]|nr:hypothetical protein [Bacteroidia bacterium]